MASSTWIGIGLVGGGVIVALAVLRKNPLDWLVPNPGKAPAPDPNKPAPDPNKPAPDPNKPAPDPNQPAPDPNKPAPTPNQPAPTPNQPAPAPEPSKPVYTVCNQYTDLGGAIRTAESMVESYKVRLNQTIAEVDGSKSVIERWTQVSLSCIWDCNDQIRNRWNCAYSYIKGETKDCWGLNMSTLNPARDKYAGILAQIKEQEDVIKSLEKKRLDILATGANCR